jgi:hypothetical protein
MNWDLVEGNGPINNAVWVAAYVGTSQAFMSHTCGV